MGAGNGLNGRRVAIAASLIAVSIAIVPTASAQQGPGGSISPQRDCQTVLTCNFGRGGKYRGCLSSYSCRACDAVPVRCRDGSRRVCQQLRCGWGA